MGGIQLLSATSTSNSSWPGSILSSHTEQADPRPCPPQVFGCFAHGSPPFWIFVRAIKRNCFDITPAPRLRHCTVSARARLAHSRRISHVIPENSVSALRRRPGYVSCLEFG